MSHEFQPEDHVMILYGKHVGKLGVVIHGLPAQAHAQDTWYFLGFRDPGMTDYFRGSTIELVSRKVKPGR